MCPKISEKPKRAHKDVMLSVNLDIIKHIWWVGFGSENAQTFFHMN